MGHQLLHILIVLNTFVMFTETLMFSYRFKVYPVDKCPMNSTEFRTAARRRNCTENSRYLCAPDKHLTSLIEFCTDQRTSLYGKDNCLKLEGSGYLNHYNCVDKFISGCPTNPYTDEEIYKYPACLTINRKLMCFVADKNCRERHNATTKAYDHGPIIENGGFETSVIVGVVILLIVILILLAGIFLYKKRIKRKGKYKVDEQNLREFLSKGELTIRHVRCIIVGCEGAGKTTLLRRLENLTFKELKVVNSTEVVDVHVNCFEVLEDEETIQRVKEKNELPTIIISTSAIEKKPKVEQLDETQTNTEILEKSKLMIDSREDYNHEENCKTEQELINSKERTEEADKSGDDYFGEYEEECFESIETQQKDMFSRKKSSIKSDKNAKSNDGDSTEVTKYLSECKKDIVKDDEKYEESRKLLLHSVGKPLSNRKRNRSPLYSCFSETNHEESNECVRTDTTRDDDEHYAISKIIDDLIKLPSENLIRPRITFLDFAGQNLYYAFHQIYLSPKTCYILVMDMSKRPSDEVSEPDVDEVDCSRFKSWKYKDYHKFWLQSIHSYSDTTTPVILVGTHDDKLSKAESVKFFREFFEDFEDFPYLRRHLHHDRTFAIGFPRKGSKLENLTDIKKCIAKLVRDSKSFKEQIRPRWAIFEQILQRKKNLRIISRQMLAEINCTLHEELRMDEEEITKMLCFLHRVGTLLYFDEKGLNQTIILDIQWFVNAFKSLINFPVNIKDTDYSRERFRCTGVIKDEELKEIWKSKEKEEYTSHKGEILPYMERLGLLAMKHENTHSMEDENKPWYYIPSMNRRKFKNTDIDKGCSKSSILCFQFDENKQLPVFLFYGIVLKCMQIPKWSILRENDNICLYENAACFLFNHHIVVVCLCKFQIQVQVWVPSKEIIGVDLLKEVQQSIEGKIREYKGYEYEIGYKCQNGVLNNENDNSFITKKKFPVSKLICDRCIVSKKHYVEDEICWVPRERQENEDTQYTSKGYEETDEWLDSIKEIKQACLDGNIEQFNFHLEKEIRPRHHLLERSDKEGWNVLHVAAKGGNLRIFCKLVSENLNICQKTHSQMTVLHIASKYGHYDICEFILKNEDFKNSVCEISSEGKNACHYAAEVGSVKLLILLVKNDIDAKAVTDNKLNIFHIACIYDQLEMCKFIFETFGDLVDVESNDGWTAALHAAKNGNTDFLEFLASKKVSLNHKSESDRNALHIACDNGHLEACKFLTETCPSLLSAPDEKGRYPVHFAARSGNLELLIYLESKTELTKETKTGMNILHMACLHDHIEMCRYILNRYPQFNLKLTVNGWTTAHYVAGKVNKKSNKIEIFEMLINADNPVNILHLSKKGNSALTVAIKYNVCEFAEYLFKNHRNLLHISNAIDPWETGNEHPKMLEILHKYLDKPC